MDGPQQFTTTDFLTVQPNATSSALQATAASIVTATPANGNVSVLVQYTTSGLAAVNAGTAVWLNWPLGPTTTLKSDQTEKDYYVRAVTTVAAATPADTAVLTVVQNPTKQYLLPVASLQADWLSQSGGGAVPVSGGLFATALQVAGFIGNGLVDDTTAFNSAVNFMISNYPFMNLTLPEGILNIKFNGTVNIDVTAGGILDFNGAFLDFTGLTGTNPAFRVYGTSDSGVTQFRQYTHGVCNAFVQGPGEGSTHDAFRLEGAATVKGAQYSFLKNIYIDSFGKGIHIAGPNCYLNRFKEIEINNCTNAFVMDNAGNTGERTIIDNCLFGGCDGDNIVIDNAGGDVYVTNSSVDFFGGNVFNITNGQLSFVNCHIEGQNNLSWGVASGNGVFVNFTDCKFIESALTAAPDPVAYFTINTPASLRFRDCFFTNFKGHDNTVLQLTTGTGTVSVSGSQMAGLSAMCPVISNNVDNLLVDGSFEGVLGTAYNTASFEMNAGGATWPGLTSAGGTISIDPGPASAFFHTGTHSLQLAKATVAGGAWDVTMYIPLPKDAGYVGWLFWMLNPASIAGTFVHGTYYTMLSEGVDPVSGYRVELRNGPIHSSNPVTPTNVWNVFSMPPGTTDQNRLGMSPLWATHVVIRLRMTQLGIGSYWVDDVMVTRW